MTKSWEKRSFYAEHGVQELLIVDPQRRSVDWLELHDGEYRAVVRSSLLGLESAALAGQIEWPATEIEDRGSIEK